MSIYTLDFNYIVEQLTPPKLRKVKLLAWLKVLSKPVANFYDRNITSYREYNSAVVWIKPTTYLRGAIVRHSNKSIYEVIVNSTVNVSPTDTNNWVKLNDTFIGSDERVKYSSQKMLFEYALNRFFLTTGIYITNNFINAASVFLIGQTGGTSSKLTNDSINSVAYMGNVPNYVTNTNDFTIFVPTALGISDNNIIRSFADKYVLAGITYNVTNY